jgi:autotransporter-associated beta strand protein
MPDGKNVVTYYNCRIKICVLGVIAILLSFPAIASATNNTYYWNASIGNWLDAAKWGGTEPTSSDYAYIQNGGTATITQTGEQCYYLYLGASGTGNSGTIEMTSGSLSVGPCEYIGNFGTGTFTQNGGTVSDTDTTYIGFSSTSNGTLNVNDGTFNTPYLYSGYGGTGSFTQYNGSVNVFSGSSGGTVVGNSSGVTGSMTIHNGSFTTPSIFLGYDGTGTISQSGGTVNATTATYIGYHSGSTGSLSISGGTYSTTNIYLAYPGTGTITLTGGTLKSSNLIKGNGTAHFYFGGGVLQATSSFSSAVALSLTGDNGNATIDTQGYTVEFSNSVTGTEPTGGLTKTGSGILTFSSTVSYSGDTAISAGTLIFLGSTSDVGDITGTGILVVGNGTSSSTLTADSINISTLTIAANSTVTISPLSGGPQSLNTDLTAVPEPSTAVLLLLAGLIAAAYYKRGTAI